jgi:hypothetical protein
MGISDWHIREITEVVESWMKCPACATYCLHCRVGLSFSEKVYYCPNPNCSIEFFDIVEDYFTDEKTDRTILDTFIEKEGLKA